MCVICSVSPKCVFTTGGATGSIDVSEIQGPSFNPELKLLEVWSFCACPFSFLPGSPV